MYNPISNVENDLEFNKMDNRTRKRVENLDLAVVELFLIKTFGVDFDQLRELVEKNKQQDK